MTAKNNIEEKLENLGRAISSDESLLENVMSRIDAIPTAEFLRIGRLKSKPILDRFVTSKLAKLASAAAIVVALFLLFGDGQNTLYAQVMKALENARTIHAVTGALRNGKWEKRAELWYERGVGLNKTQWCKGKKMVVIDDGRHRWEYSSDNDFAVQSASLNRIGLPGELLVPQEYLKKYKFDRDPRGDMVIDGFQCELYAASYSEQPDAGRMMFWIDAEKRLRQFEQKVLRDGAWETIERGKAEYDVEFDPNVFAPNFGPDVRIVELDDKILDNYFNLDRAVFTKEALGLVFAVHRLDRVEGDLIYAVCSLRPTDATRKEVRSSDNLARNYGDFDFYQGPRLSKWKYFPIKLATIYHGGFMVKSVLLCPSAIGQKMKMCELPVRIGNEGRLFGKRKKGSLATQELFDPIALLPLSEEKIGLEDLLTEVYSRARQLEPFVAYGSLSLKSVPFTDKEMEEWIRQRPSSEEAKRWRPGSKGGRLSHAGASKPSEIGKEDWARDRVGYLQEVKNRRE